MYLDTDAKQPDIRT